MLAITSHGGHLGYYEGLLAGFTKKRWLPRPSLEFVTAVLEANPEPRRNPSHPIAEKIPEVGDDFVYDLQRPDIGFKLVGEDELIKGGTASAGSAEMAMTGL